MAERVSVPVGQLLKLRRENKRLRRTVRSQTADVDAQRREATLWAERAAALELALEISRRELARTYIRLKDEKDGQEIRKGDVGGT